jgi:hypothetical protein
MFTGFGTSLLVYFLLGMYGIQTGNVDLAMFLLAVALFINLLGNSLYEHYLTNLIKYTKRDN